MHLKISEDDFENLANCINALAKIFGNISTEKEKDIKQPCTILHFVKGGNDNEKKERNGNE